MMTLVFSATKPRHNQLKDFYTKSYSHNILKHFRPRKIYHHGYANYGYATYVTKVKK